MVKMHVKLEAYLLELKQRCKDVPLSSPPRAPPGAPTPAATSVLAAVRVADAGVDATEEEAGAPAAVAARRGPSNKETASMMYRCHSKYSHDGEYSHREGVQHGKTAGILCSRWAKLIKDFYKPKKGTFDTTKVPDLYDNALYDMVHNRHLQLGSLPEVCAAAALQPTPSHPVPTPPHPSPLPRSFTSTPQVYGAARTLASYVVPQEYGVAAQDKVEIGVKI